MILLKIWDIFITTLAKNFKETQNREIWFDDKCLAIRYKLFLKNFMMKLNNLLKYNYNNIILEKKSLSALFLF